MQIVRITTSNKHKRKQKQKPLKTFKVYTFYNVFYYCQAQYFIYLMFFLMSNLTFSCFNLLLFPLAKKKGK